MKKKKKTPTTGKDGNYRCRGRVWVEGPEGTFLGYGRVVLLERIDEYGSIAKAARSMEMSYKHAWDLLGSMNRQLGSPVVETTRGGRGGGGARLTENGHRAVRGFWALHERFQLLLVKETAAFAAEWGSP